MKFDETWVESRDAVIVAITFSAISFLIIFFVATKHLINFTSPKLQVYTLRVLFICPIYGLTSAGCMFLGSEGIYLETVRDVYEAFVIYSFMSLVL